MVKYSSLKTALEAFQGANEKKETEKEQEELLQPQFRELAEYLFYGGYLLVNKKRKVYLMDVEFYYHEEEGVVKDWIMYNRNSKSGKKPYLPLGTLNAHQSGIDITFESEEKKYRAAVLVRGYAVEEEGKLIKEYDQHSTHLYNDLFMAYPLMEGVHLEWVHETMEKDSNEKIKETVRKNVATYYINEHETAEKCQKEDNATLTEDGKYIQDVRPWRFIRQRLLNDNETNRVYFSEWLKQDFEEVYEAVCRVLENHKVWHGVLNGTRDYWCRDYMPVQVSKGRFVRYRYTPDYLKNEQQYMTNPKVACSKLKEEWWKGVEWKELDLVVDGGNVVRCGNTVVMTEKVFAENPDVPQAKVREMLEEVFGAEVLFLPWDKEEKYGHSDGVVRYVGNGRVVMTNYRDFDPKMADEMKKRLEQRFKVVELTYSTKKPDKNSWAYINFLQTERVIVVPKLKIEEDAEALEQIKRLFPEYGERVVQVDASPLVEQGGAWNCVSWNVKR